MTIKFNKHNVTNTVTKEKARVTYHIANRRDGRKAVTLYAKDYGHALARVMPAAQYTNNTDICTDYFETGTVYIFEGDDLYPAALAMAQRIEAEREAKYSRRAA